MKYFLDFGGHGMIHFIDQYNIDNTWTVYTFEPNRESFKILKDIKYKDCNIHPINKGIWISNSVLTFNPETTSESYGSSNDGAGSTFLELNDWNIKNGGNWGAGKFNESYDVETINISSFIRGLENTDFLLIKMDIEGSEYTVLRKMIEDDTIDMVNDIYVEFHDWAMDSETEQSTNDIINTIKSKGVNIKKWI